MNQNTKGVIFTMLGGIFWGISGIIGKYLFDEKQLTAVWLVTLRLLSAGLLMLMLAAVQKKGDIFRVWKKKRTAVSQLVFCLFGMTACQMSYFLAIQYSNPGTATVPPVHCPGADHAVLSGSGKEKAEASGSDCFSLRYSRCFPAGDSRRSGKPGRHRQGFVLGLAAAVALAVYNIQPEKLLNEFGSMETGMGKFIGGLLMIPVTGFFHVPGIWDMTTVLFGTGRYHLRNGDSVWMLSGRRPSAGTRESQYVCVCGQPLVAAVMSALLLGEVFVGVDVLGFALIIGGVTSLAVFDRS